MPLIQARKRQKARQQTSRAITTTVILSIVITVLGYVLYRQLNYTPPVTQTASNTIDQEPIDLSKLDLNLSEPKWKDLAEDQLENDNTESDEPDEDEKLFELPRVSADDLPQRKFEFLQTREMQKVWQRIRPRLISLDVRTDLGTSPSVGTIVDSRGWALTCLLYTSPSPRDS